MLCPVFNKKLEFLGALVVDDEQFRQSGERMQFYLPQELRAEYFNPTIEMGIAVARLNHKLVTVIGEKLERKQDGRKHTCWMLIVVGMQNCNEQEIRGYLKDGDYA